MENKLNSNNVNPYSSYLNQSSGNYQDITPIFGGNIKYGVQPFVDKSIVSNVQKLQIAYPSLYVTDSLRNQQTNKAVGVVDNSGHLSGKVLDFRYPNSEMEKLIRNTDSWKSFGIGNIITHGEGSNKHYHVEFL